jgi:class 3 adenylate cyclase
VSAQDSLVIYQLIEKGISSPDKFTFETEEQFDHVFRLADSLGVPKFKYDVLERFGTAYKEKVPEWSLGKLVRAQALANASPSVEVSKKVLFDIGYLYHYSTQTYDLALSNYLECEKFIEQPGEPTLANFYPEIIAVCLKVKNDELAMSYLGKAWEYAQKTENKELSLQVTGHQLAFDEKNHNYKDLINHSNRILPYVSSENGYRVQYQLQGSAYRELNQIDEAILAYKKALTYTSYPPHLHLLYLDLAVSYQKTGQFEEVVGYYNLAIKNAPKNSESLARTHLLFARTYYTFRASEKLQNQIQKARTQNHYGRQQTARLDTLTKMILDTLYFDTEYLIEKYSDNQRFAEQALAEKYRVIAEIKAYSSRERERRIKEEIFEKTKKQEIEKQAEKQAKNQAILVAENEKNKRELEVSIEREQRITAEKEIEEARADEAEEIAKRIKAELASERANLATERANKEKLIAENEKKEAQRLELKAKAEASDAKYRARTADLEIAKAKAQEDIEKGKVREQRYVLIGLMFILLLGSYFLYRNYKQKKTIVKNKIEIEKEKERSDNLLLSILPLSITEELKTHQTVQPKHYEQVSVLFSDFKGFTRISESLKPTELLEKLNTFFALFDEISKENNLERIKTIGDAYMAAGGLPEENETNAVDAVHAALSIQMALRDTKFKLGIPEEDWQMRVGVHTGPVVAGVVGTTKFAYDIWGDAVNIASRLESNSEPGQVNISRETYELVKDHFECKYRGEIEIKNRGKIEMYFVVREKMVNT